MLVTTTPSLEGKQIERYLGIVTGEAIMGANVVRDFLASVTDIIGGRSSAYENKLSEGREIAIKEMEEKARRLGANAVVGVDLDFETLRDGMMMCIATGTAVYVKDTN
ncbi:YbjQ family protein [Bacillus dakarensis]|uniref:YbjQ family protein n=1 Tax=Robertmurraya dakarensis TaxID=1926278 RepID=UPI0009825BF4|nr:YbjQ family protein [Bacillus dakarensis]